MNHITQTKHTNEDIHVQRVINNINFYFFIGHYTDSHLKLTNILLIITNSFILWKISTAHVSESVKCHKQLFFIKSHAS